jgi:hypothetical protein
MEKCGLVSFERVGKEKVVVARRDAGKVRALRALRAPMGSQATKRRRKARLRAALAHYGAPLFVAETEVGTPPGVEEAVASGLRLAHEDPAVAGNLPVVLWLNRELDVQELATLALRAGEGQTLGFMLELTNELSGTAVFKDAADALRDKRHRKLKNFFSRDGRFGPYEEELAQLNTPEVAKRWHFLMNTGLDSFQSYFRKGVSPSVRLAP